jgi:hypothetical protein
VNRRIAVLLTLAGALLVIVATSRPWAQVTVSGLPSLNNLSVSGHRLAPAGLPVALAVAAGAFVLAISGRIVRYGVGAVLVLAGASLAASELVSGRSRSGVVHKALEDSLGIVNRSGGTGSDSFLSTAVVHQNALYLLYVVGALVILAAGLFTLVTGRSWPTTGRRFERTPTAADASDASIHTVVTDPTAAGESSVDQLSPNQPGVDQLSPDQSSVEALSGSRTRRNLAGAAGRSASSRAAADVWDALSRGEDPTSSANDPT